MYIQSATIVSGILLAEPLLGKVSWLKTPVEKFNSAFLPYRPYIGLLDLFLASAGFIVNIGFFNTYSNPYSMFYAEPSQIIAAFLVGILLAEHFLEKYFSRMGWCDTLHEYEPYIGLGGIIIGTSAFL